MLLILCTNFVTVTRSLIFHFQSQLTCTILYVCYCMCVSAYVIFVTLLSCRRFEHTTQVKSYSLLIEKSAKSMTLWHNTPLFNPCLLGKSPHSQLDMLTCYHGYQKILGNCGMQRIGQHTNCANLLILAFQFIQVSHIHRRTILWLGHHVFSPQTNHTRVCVEVDRDQ